MKRHIRSTTLLGLNLSTESLEQTLSDIEHLLQVYKKDLQPRYIAAISMDHITQSLSCFSQEARHPELLKVLRHSSLSTFDSKGMLFLSKLLGSNPKELVTSHDLLPKLAESLMKNHHSIYLLGGEEKSLKLCVLYLQALYPKIKIVGASHPRIYISGDDLDSYEARDALIVEQINKSNPDVLFLNLGTPKQEIWFDRIRPKLQVPVTVGVGGAFDLLTGIKPEAPAWMRSSGMEWLWDLTREPGKFFCRNLVALLKFTFMAIPLVIFYHWNKGIYYLFHRKNDRENQLPPSLLFISSTETVVLQQFPPVANEETSEEFAGRLDDLFSQDAAILDFSNLTHITPEGLAGLVYFARQAKKEKKNFLCLGINNDIKLLMQLQHVWDIFSLHTCHSAEEALIRLDGDRSGSGFFDSIRHEHNNVIINFFGKLDHNQDYEAYLKKIGPILFKKDCVIDLTYVSFIDSAGIGFLLRLKRLESNHLHSFKLRGAGKSLKRQLKLAGIDKQL